MNILGFNISRRPQSIVVNTYHVKQTDAQKLRDAKCRQLAAELGMPWPPADPWLVEAVRSSLEDDDFQRTVGMA